MPNDGREAAGGSAGTKGQPALREAALFGLGPRFGERTLFADLIFYTDRCRVRGLDLSRFDVGDGPAAFLTLVIGAILVGMATWLVVAVSPPLWVDVLLWVPLGVASTIGGLLFAKAALLWSEHLQKAGEAGR